MIPYSHLSVCCQNEDSSRELKYFERIRNLKEFRQTPEPEIRSSGYIIDTVEAAIWSLISTDNFRDALLKAVNLGGDTDTIAAIAGGLAGLYYGYDNIPGDWLAVIRRRRWIEDLYNDTEKVIHR